VIQRRSDYGEKVAAIEGGDERARTRIRGRGVSASLRKSAVVNVRPVGGAGKGGSSESDCMKTFLRGIRRYPSKNSFSLQREKFLGTLGPQKGVGTPGNKTTMGLKINGILTLQSSQY